MRISLWCAAVLCCGVSAMVAQTQSPGSARSLCIKVLPGKDADFRKLIADVTKPATQARADAGEVNLRIFMRSVFPAGTEAVCDYSLIDVYPGFPPDPKTTLTAEAAYAKGHVAMKPSEFATQRDAASRLRKTELWRVRDVLGSPATGNYLRQNFVKVAPENRAAWLKLEQETFKPVHQARMDSGAFKGWALLLLAMPSGSAQPYDAMTVDIYKDWASIDAPSKYDEAFKKVGKAAMDPAFAEAAKLRGAFVRTELYEVLDVIRPAR